MSDMVQEIYPAPNSFGESPINIERVQQALRDSPDDAALHFLLGNAHLRLNEAENAAVAYKKALELKPGWAEVRCNLGVAYKLLGRDEEAVSELNQVILSHPDLDLAYLHLAQVRIRLGESMSAVQALTRLLENTKTRVEAWTQLGALQHAVGKIDEAIQSYQQALVHEPTNSAARRYLAQFGFSRGRIHFEQGEYAEAFKCWHEWYAIVGDTLLTDEETARGFKELIHEFSRTGAREAVISDFRTLANREQVDLSVWAVTVRKVLFTQGLIPQLYVSDNRIAEEDEHWHQEFERGDEPPYARYRLGIIALYERKCSECFEQLRICADRMPEKKQEALRIPQLLEVVHGVVKGQGLSFSRSRKGARLFDEELWKEAGFPSAFQWRAWAQEGFAPGEAAQWRDSGFIAERARAWADADFTASVAQLWDRAEFVDVSMARRWHRAGFSPGDARKWSDDFSGTLEAAVQCRQIGFPEPQVAEQWMRVFSLPWDAISWFQVGFTPAEALEWTYSEIRDPYEALSWKNQGVSPTEAAMRRAIVINEITDDEPSEGSK